MTSILKLRKNKTYRFLEGFLAMISIGFFIFLVILAAVNPTVYSIFLIIYSFLWLLKFCLNVFYTIFSFKESNRWQTFDFSVFFDKAQENNLQNSQQNSPNLETNRTYQIQDESLAQIDYLQSFSYKFKTIGWSQKIQKDLTVLTDLVNQNSKFQPKNIWHLPIFAVYNEPSSVLIRSLRKILENNYDLSKIIVVISQEARAGEDFNRQIRQEISQENWLETHFENFNENKNPEFGENNSNLNKSQSQLSDLDSNGSVLKLNLQKNLNQNLNSKEKTETILQLGLEQELQIKTENEANLEIENNLQIQKEKPKIQSKIQTKLQVYFVEHPDGLVGEIKGKASNEDWGARFGAKVLQNLQIDKELVLVTSLDADSYLKKDFFRQLSYRFCLSPNRLQAAFQPVHNYNHNFFEIGFWPRLVATGTTFYNLTNLALEDQISTFAIYSVPLVVLEEVDFWVREVIAEDSLLFLKSLVHFDGDFVVIPFYGQMEADSVEHHDYLEEIISQYRQLQRWAWGGVEGFPYLFWQFFQTPKGKLIDTRIRLKWLYLLFSNHFFWATTPLIFGIGPFLPNFLHGNSFMATSTSQNLATFSQFFAWISFIFTFVFGYLTIVFIALKNSQTSKFKYSNSQNSKTPKNTNSKENLQENEQIKLTWTQVWAIIVQITVSPFIYFLMAIPALDAQIRGFFGNYLGYWVTPKK